MSSPLHLQHNKLVPKESVINLQTLLNVMYPQAPRHAIHDYLSRWM